MMLEKQQPTLTILDVGHGSAAVLRDHGGIVVFDAGAGQYLRRFLHANGIKTVDILLLSHADSDHSSGAISVLRDDKLLVKQLYLNPDPTKKSSHSFKQLCLAVAEALRERGTTTETSLTSVLTGRLDQGDVHIEVLYPPPEVAMRGVGSSDLSGADISSNSLSAAIRLLHQGKSVVFLGADIEFACLEDLRARGANVKARILVFPHHGGLPGRSDENNAGIFAYQVGQYVQPEVVVFSIHRTRHELPRQEVTQALIQAIGGVRFLCTQVPPRIRDAIISSDPGPWGLHRNQVGDKTTFREGNIVVEFVPDHYPVSIVDT